MGEGQPASGVSSVQKYAEGLFESLGFRDADDSGTIDAPKSVADTNEGYNERVDINMDGHITPLEALGFIHFVLQDSDQVKRARRLFKIDDESRTGILKLFKERAAAIQKWGSESITERARKSEKLTGVATVSHRAGVDRESVLSMFTKAIEAALDPAIMNGRVFVVNARIKPSMEEAEFTPQEINAAFNAANTNAILAQMQSINPPAKRAEALMQLVQRLGNSLKKDVAANLLRAACEVAIALPDPALRSSTVDSIKARLNDLGFNPELEVRKLLKKFSVTSELDKAQMITDGLDRFLALRKVALRIPEADFKRDELVKFAEHYLEAAGTIPAQFLPSAIAHLAAGAAKTRYREEAQGYLEASLASAEKIKDQEMQIRAISIALGKLRQTGINADFVTKAALNLDLKRARTVADPRRRSLALADVALKMHYTGYDVKPIFDESEKATTSIEDPDRRTLAREDIYNKMILAGLAAQIAMDKDAVGVFAQKARSAMSDLLGNDLKSILLMEDQEAMIQKLFELFSDAARSGVEKMPVYDSLFNHATAALNMRNMKAAVASLRAHVLAEFSVIGAYNPMEFGSVMDYIMKELGDSPTSKEAVLKNTVASIGRSSLEYTGAVEEREIFKKALRIALSLPSSRQLAQEISKAMRAVGVGTNDLNAIAKESLGARVGDIMNLADDKSKAKALLELVTSAEGEYPDILADRIETALDGVRTITSGPEALGLVKDLFEITKRSIPDSSEKFPILLGKAFEAMAFVKLDSVEKFNLLAKMVDEATKRVTNRAATNDIFLRAKKSAFQFKEPILIAEFLTYVAVTMCNSSALGDKKEEAISMVKQAWQIVSKTTNPYGVAYIAHGMSLVGEDSAVVVSTFERAIELTKSNSNPAHAASDVFGKIVDAQLEPLPKTALLERLLGTAAAVADVDGRIKLYSEFAGRILKSAQASDTNAKQLLQKIYIEEAKLHALSEDPEKRAKGVSGVAQKVALTGYDQTTALTLFRQAVSYAKAIEEPKDKALTLSTVANDMNTAHVGQSEMIDCFVCAYATAALIEDPDEKLETIQNIQSFVQHLDKKTREKIMSELRSLNG